VSNVNYMDILLLGNAGWHIYLALAEGWRRSFFAVCRDIVALALALLLRAPLSVGVTRSPWFPRFAATMDIHIALPAGGGLTFSGALQWLEEVQLPRAIARAIAGVWQRDSGSDVSILLGSARHILAEAMVNLVFLLALFVGLRALINVASKAVVWALPKETAGDNVALKLALGMTQSTLVGLLLLAALLPLSGLAAMPRGLFEQLGNSRLVFLLNYILHHINFYGLL